MVLGWNGCRIASGCQRPIEWWRGHSAWDRGFGFIIVDEGTADCDEQAHREALRAFDLYFGRMALSADDVIKALDVTRPCSGHGLFKRHRGRPTRLFFATDMHGFTPTFRKFLKAVQFYDVDVLVCGGDVSGKLLVPIIEHERGRYRVRFQKKDHELDGEAELQAFQDRLEMLGFY